MMRALLAPYFGVAFIAAYSSFLAAEDCGSCDGKRGDELLACERERAACEARELAKQITEPGAEPGIVKLPSVKVPKVKAPRW